MDDFAQLDHYSLLGINHSATLDEIKQAYRQHMRRYHPDRMASASPEEQAYAGRRALRINEAYQILSDHQARAAYNRSLGSHVPPPPRPQPQPARPRDHQAELYDLASEHLVSGRILQAVATLRELLQLNPFYRDAASLLAQAEAALEQQHEHEVRPHNNNRRTLIIGAGSSLLLMLMGGTAWWLRRAAASPTNQSEATATPVPTNNTDIASVQVTANVIPTTLPTATPAPSVTPAPTQTPKPLVESGPLAYAEDFNGGAWPTTSGNGWSVGSEGGTYAITAQRGVGNIWVYRTSPTGSEMLVGVDISVRGGEAGLVLRFNDESTYLAFLVNPASRSFRLEQHLAGQVTTLLDESHPAIQTGNTTRNRLAAYLEGEQMSLRVNGYPVAVLNLADPPPAPRYGMVAVAGDTSVTANFYDLSLRSV